MSITTIAVGALVRIQSDPNPTGPCYLVTMIVGDQADCQRFNEQDELETQRVAIADLELVTHHSRRIPEGLAAAKAEQDAAKAVVEAAHAAFVAESDRVLAEAEAERDAHRAAAEEEAAKAQALTAPAGPAPQAAPDAPEPQA